MMPPSDRELLTRIITERPNGVSARRVAAHGIENELDLWKLQRAMTVVHQIDLRRWTHRDAHFVDLVKSARRDLWRAYLSGYLAGVEVGNDDPDAE